MLCHFCSLLTCISLIEIRKQAGRTSNNEIRLKHALGQLKTTKEISEVIPLISLLAHKNNEFLSCINQKYGVPNH